MPPYFPPTCNGYDSISIFLVGDNGQVEFKVRVDEFLKKLRSREI